MEPIAAARRRALSVRRPAWLGSRLEPGSVRESAIMGATKAERGIVAAHCQKVDKAAPLWRGQSFKRRTRFAVVAFCPPAHGLPPPMEMRGRETTADESCFGASRDGQGSLLFVYLSLFRKCLFGVGLRSEMATVLLLLRNDILL